MEENSDKCDSDNDILTRDFNEFGLCTDDGSDTHYNNDVRAAEPYQFEPISCKRRRVIHTTQIPTKSSENRLIDLSW